jgi:NAD(P)-dependent dehydrogenase (short-subunit alcohol dehydrogenase family)
LKPGPTSTRFEIDGPQFHPPNDNESVQPRPRQEFPLPHPPAPVSLPAPGQSRPALNLSHMVALVTGGSSGIGRTTAQLLAALGATVAISGRREERLRETAATIEATGGTCAVLVGDVREASTPADWVELATKQFGKLTCLVNNAGVIGSGSVLTTSDEEWDRLFDTNVKGLFRISRAASSALVSAPKEDAASIVNLASVTGTRPYANLLGYCASKAAVCMMTECMAMDLAPEGVRVNGVNPGVVRSELHTVTNVVADYDAFLERSKETHPIGRAGEPEDIAWAIAFLASREAGWITGHNMAVDGGRNCTSAR